jgi:hypothetical protein
MLKLRPIGSAAHGSRYNRLANWPAMRLPTICCRNNTPGRLHPRDTFCRTYILKFTCTYPAVGTGNPKTRGLANQSPTKLM